ncbi:uncharacterized protein LAESUDRAFT_726716 [Laetiporus sulphureus 93-53]|uniref:Uncharacterized protein n=1 Tax=Laetiporus sulphureus 93-53 TaxID=1314785 RepID=A0A165DWF2_9APHY|nr:uncharacterized protein LAESUDRAFT_726716 [Laetiporus sulphureus 93-53]KZT05770.1 hypothetical protein LAESUDRAFT_726716 [Laetiporus sulphureus 93-53]
MVYFPLEEAQIVSLFVQSVTYGIHVVTFTLCAWSMLHRRTEHGANPVNWAMLSVATTLFVIGTVDLALNLYINIHAFIFYTGHGGPTADFANLSNWSHVVRSVTTQLQILIADATLIHRCWIVRNHQRRVIALPVLIWFADVAAAIAYLYYTARSSSDPSLVRSRKSFLSAFIILSDIVNIVTTALIVIQIWWIHKQSTQHLCSSSRDSGRLSLARINRIFIDSAILYTGIGIIGFIVEVSQSNAVYAVLSLSVEIAGIQFNLIMLRISSGNATERTEAAMETPTLKFRSKTTTQDQRDTVSAAETTPEFLISEKLSGDVSTSGAAISVDEAGA